MTSRGDTIDIESSMRKFANSDDKDSRWKSKTTENRKRKHQHELVVALQSKRNHNRNRSLDQRPAKVREKKTLRMLRSHQWKTTKDVDEPKKPSHHLSKSWQRVRARSKCGNNFKLSKNQPRKNEFSFDLRNRFEND